MVIYRFKLILTELNLLKGEGRSGGVDGKLYSMPRTCQEMQSADPSLQSGNYYVDPDGTNIGDAPINVYCNMSTGRIQLKVFVLKDE